MNILKKEDFKEIWDLRERIDNQTRPQPSRAMPQHPEDAYRYSAPVESRPSRILSSEPSGTLVVGPGVFTKGEFTDCVKTEVHGCLEGNLFTDSLIVHPGGQVTGTIKCETALISGKVKGEISASTSISVEKTGLVEGKISYQKISVSEGGKLEGSLHQLEQESDEVGPKIEQSSANNFLVPDTSSISR